MTLTQNFIESFQVGYMQNRYMQLIIMNQLTCDNLFFPHL